MTGITIAGIVVLIHVVVNMQHMDVVQVTMTTMMSTGIKMTILKEINIWMKIDLCYCLELSY